MGFRSLLRPCHESARHCSTARIGSLPINTDWCRLGCSGLCLEQLNTSQRMSQCPDIGQGQANVHISKCPPQARIVIWNKIKHFIVSIFPNVWHQESQLCFRDMKTSWKQKWPELFSFWVLKHTCAITTGRVSSISPTLLKIIQFTFGICPVKWGTMKPSFTGDSTSVKKIRIVHVHFLLSNVENFH